MKRNTRLYLQDIWDSILAIEEYTQNLTEEEFYSNRDEYLTFMLISYINPSL